MSEGAAAGALDVDAIRERVEFMLAREWVDRHPSAWGLARDVLALVADREALLERIQQLENGGSAAVRSGGDA